MTHLNFQWGDDKYTWDLTKAGKCTLGYVIIFVTGYHFLHVVMRLLKDLTEGKEVKAQKDSTDGEEKSNIGNNEKTSNKNTSVETKNKESQLSGKNPPPEDIGEKTVNITPTSKGIEERKKEK